MDLDPVDRKSDVWESEFVVDGLDVIAWPFQVDSRYCVSPWKYSE